MNLALSCFGIEVLLVDESYIWKRLKEAAKREDFTLSGLSSCGIDVLLSADTTADK